MSRSTRSGPRAAPPTATAAVDQPAGVIEVALATHVVACAAIDVCAMHTRVADTIKHPADLHVLIDHFLQWRTISRRRQRRRQRGWPEALVHGEDATRRTRSRDRLRRLLHQPEHVSRGR